FLEQGQEVGTRLGIELDQRGEVERGQHEAEDEHQPVAARPGHGRLREQERRRKKGKHARIGRHQRQDVEFELVKQVQNHCVRPDFAADRQRTICGKSRKMEMVKASSSLPNVPDIAASTAPTASSLMPKDSVCSWICVRACSRLTKIPTRDATVIGMKERTMTSIMASEMRKTASSGDMVRPRVRCRFPPAPARAWTSRRP